MCLIGLFAGLSLEGTILIERKDANRDFYGSPIPARDILGGRVPPPEVASRLYEIIEVCSQPISQSSWIDLFALPRLQKVLMTPVSRKLPTFPLPLASMFQLVVQCMLVLGPPIQLAWLLKVILIRGKWSSMLIGVDYHGL